jgi:nucleoside phosphorylase
MSVVLIIIPKEDEMGVATKVFGLSDKFLGDEPIEINTEWRLRVWKTRIDALEVVVVALDAQTNTMSGVLTMYLIDRYSPDFAILQGTCLGDAKKVPIGSVILAKAIKDVSEKRLESGQYRDRPNGPHQNFISKIAMSVLGDPEHFFNAVFDIDGVSKRYRELAAEDKPKLAYENILSSNEYRRMEAGFTDVIWNDHSDCRGYEMEAAGFVWACKMKQMPWLVVRGVSDHGTVESVSELNRTFSSISAALMVRQILEKTGQAIVKEINRDSRTVATQGVSLAGTWSGYMGYFNSEQDPVIFEETGTMRQEGSHYIGEFNSKLIEGKSRHNDLAYTTNFEVEYHNAVGGTWLDNDNSREYFGVILGATESVRDGKFLKGQWLGTYSKGVRGGFFIWYNAPYKEDRKSLKSEAKRQMLKLLDERRSGTNEH